MSESFKAEKKNPVMISDTTFRDGHQSSLATRMRTEDMLPVAEEMDKVGFYSMEVWGGATFDVCTRFLNEDPWERVRILKKHIPNTPFSMLLRGQNLVGYRHYADDVVEAFVHKSSEVGIDIFRVFDALNDERNFEKSFAVIKECKKHIQATICYSLTEKKLGGPVFNIEYFVNKAKILQDMGADTLCIKDMAGLISPYDVYELIKALKENISIPIQLHTHYTSGMASMAYLKAIEAGVDIIDCSLAPFALRSSQPAVEPMVVALQNTPRDTGLDLNLLFEIGEHIESIAPKYRDFLNLTKMSVIDTGVLLHQIPGGMTTNLVSQLKQADALDKINEVYEELPKTRKDLGYPPLVTPTSQIIGIQAVQNVLFGRYKMITAQVKDYAYGLYGKTPVPMDKEVQKLILKGYERGEEPITCRAADILEPELEKAKEAVKDIAKDIGDVLIYTLYPTTGMKFLRWKYGLEEPPQEVKPKTMEDIERENELIAKAKAGKLVEKAEKFVPEKGSGMRTFNVFIEDEYYEVQVEEVGGTPVILSSTPSSRPATSGAPAPQKQEKKEEAKKAPTVSVAEGQTPIVAPMPGMIIRYEVSVGDKVKNGDVVVVFEAMKMENALTSPVDGTVQSIHFKEGDTAEKSQILAVIA
ncbi:MAG: pyruvate/oxaloacetate carboxyltransferase [Thermodesulfobacteriota bacterium]|nr:pyruvate/oxaloacetate carboxyltransferase [Thermodesulfobacteriota bacterium]